MDPESLADMALLDRLRKKHPAIPVDFDLAGWLNELARRVMLTLHRQDEGVKAQRKQLTLMAKQCGQLAEQFKQMAQGGNDAALALLVAKGAFAHEAGIADFTRLAALADELRRAGRAANSAARSLPTGKGAKSAGQVDSVERDVKELVAQTALAAWAEWTGEGEPKVSRKGRLVAMPFGELLTDLLALYGLPADSIGSLHNFVKNLNHQVPHEQAVGK
jgi:hypothetical protein